MAEMKHLKVQEWSNVFSGIYSQADSERSPEQIWIAVMAHTSSIGESIRRVSFMELMDTAAHTFCWLCSFLNKCNVVKDDVFSLEASLNGIVSLKYPGVCGHCGEAHCTCDPVRMDALPDKAAQYEILFEKRKLVLQSWENFSLDDCLNVFNGIYGGRIHIQTLESIGFHFLEETGEAASAIRQLSQLRSITENKETGIDLEFLRRLTTVEGIVSAYKEHHGIVNFTERDPRVLRARVVQAKMAMVIEIADTFSWFCGILNKVKSISKSIFNEPNPRIPSLEKQLTDVYLDSNQKGHCPTCKQPVCACAFYNSK